MAKRFKWLLDSAYPRVGPKLIKGEIHDVEDYPPKVVDEWVKTKAAKFEPEKKDDSPEKSIKKEKN